MRRVVVLVAAWVMVSGCVTTFHTNPASVAPAREGRRIVLLAPDVELSILNVGGLMEPQAEWTSEAERHIAAELGGRFRAMGADLVAVSPLSADAIPDNREVQLMKLHGTVGNAILVHQYGDIQRLPTKKGGFDWGIGPEATHLKQKYDADYALFVFVRDSYSSGGRAVAFVVAAAFGVGLQMGMQLGFASLVDLETGDIVWFNRLARGVGDLRTEEGARETLAVLLSGFPQ